MGAFRDCYAAPGRALHTVCMSSGECYHSLLRFFLPTHGRHIPQAWVWDAILTFGEDCIMLKKKGLHLPDIVYMLSR